VHLRAISWKKGSGKSDGKLLKTPLGGRFLLQSRPENGTYQGGILSGFGLGNALEDRRYLNLIEFNRSSQAN